MKKLILTADDFGMAECVNEAVTQAHLRGVLTSASLMVNGVAFEDAVLRVKRTPSLAVGLHLVLVRGRSTLSQRHIPDLVDFAGNFRANSVGAGFRYFFDSRLRPQLEAEIRAQIEKFISAGLPFDHLNGHLNIHMHPTVWDLLLKLHDEYRLPAIRISSQPWWHAVVNHRQHFVSKTLHSLAFRPLARRARRTTRDTHIVHAQRVHGLLESGNVNEEYLLKLLPVLPDGLTEIYFHPAITPSGDYLKAHPNYDGEAEFLALTSARVKDFIRQSSIRLVTYNNAAEN